jgi:hypothetical protein
VDSRNGSQKKVQVTIECMTKISTFLDIKEMQVRRIMRSYLTPVMDERVPSRKKML